MRVWRICQAERAAAAFSGEGSRRYAGRWHHAGVPVIYTAESLSLAALEMLAHFDRDLDPGRFVVFAVDIAAAIAVRRLTPAQLPGTWRDFPAPEETRELGTAWVKAAKTVGLIVPSALIPQERNVLLNPAHADFAKLHIGPPEAFAFDSRLTRPRRR